MVLAVAVTVMRACRRLSRCVSLATCMFQVFRNIPGIALLIIVVYALPPLKVVLPYRALRYRRHGPGLGLWLRNFMSGSTPSASARWKPPARLAGHEL